MLDTVVAKQKALLEAEIGEITTTAEHLRAEIEELTGEELPDLK